MWLDEMSLRSQRLNMTFGAWDCLTIFFFQFDIVSADQGPLGHIDWQTIIMFSSILELQLEMTLVRIHHQCVL